MKTIPTNKVKTSILCMLIVKKSLFIRVANNTHTYFLNPYKSCNLSYLMKLIYFLSLLVLSLPGVLGENCLSIEQPVPNTEIVFEDSGKIILCPGTYIIPQGISIYANNLELICNQTILSGDNSYDPNPQNALIQVKTDNVSISGCTFTNTTTAIYATPTTSNLLIEENYFDTITQIIHLEGTEHTIINNNAYYPLLSTGGGFIISGGEQHTILNNQLEGDIFISLENSNHSIIQDNSLTDSGSIHLTNTDNTFVRSNELAKPSYDASSLIFSQGNNNNIIGNILSGKRGITLLWAKNNAVTHNYIENSTIAIALNEAEDFLVYHNTLQNNEKGIASIRTTGGTIEFNTFSKNNIGTHMRETLSTTLTNNLFTQNTVGIFYEQSTDQISQDNTFMLNEQGIVLENTNLASTDFSCFNQQDVICTNSQVSLDGTCSISSCGLCATACPSCDDPSSYVCGDINMDGILTITDVTLLTNHLFITFEPLYFPCSADLNRDNKVTITDLTKLVNFMFKNGAELSCGTI